jgi:hypothetical protein
VDENNRTPLWFSHLDHVELDAPTACDSLSLHRVPPLRQHPQTAKSAEAGFLVLTRIQFEHKISDAVLGQFFTQARPTPVSPERTTSRVPTDSASIVSRWG